MEDFSLAQQAEPKKQESALVAEWMDNLKLASTNAGAEALLSLLCLDNDKPGDNRADKANASDKSEAEKLDKELRDFADAKVDDASHNMSKFQKALAKYCDTADKVAAFDELGEYWTRLSTLMNLESNAIYKELKELDSTTPGRKELKAELRKKESQFSEKINRLPFEQYWDIIQLMKWQEGETKAQHDERIRKGLSGNKTVLAAYDEILAAEAKIEAHKTPREKQLEYLGRQHRTDSKKFEAQVEKAYLRSTIKN